MEGTDGLFEDMKKGGDFGTLVIEVAAESSMASSDRIPRRRLVRSFILVLAQIVDCISPSSVW